MQSLFRRTPSAQKEPRRMSMGQLSGASALHDAVSKGKLHLARFILDAVDGEGPVNSQDKHGKTPLLRAVRIENEQVRMNVMKLLIKHAADVNVQDNMGRTALSYACELFHNDVVSLLVKNNVDPNLEDNNGNTPLMYCAMAGNAEAIEIITKSFRRLGLEVDKMNADGMTPLIMAARKKNEQCALHLVQEGRASVDKKDSIHNMTAIDWARDSGWNLPEINNLKMKTRRTSKIDHMLLSSGVSSNESSSEQINSLAKVNYQKADPRDFLTVKHDLASRVRSNSAPREHSGDSVEGTKGSSGKGIKSSIYDLDGKRASLPDFMLSSTVRTKDDTTTENVATDSPTGVNTNGMFVKRTHKKQFKMRPFSAISKPPRQSKSFDSAIGRDSSSLENLCGDKGYDGINGKKQKYLLSADPKQLLAMIPLSKSSDALPRYTHLKKDSTGYHSSSESFDADFVSTRGIEPFARWETREEPSGRSRSATPKLPPLI